MSHRVQERRRRTQIGHADETCGLCGSTEVILVESRNVRHGLALVNPRWRATLRRYVQCRACGSRMTVMDDRWN